MKTWKLARLGWMQKKAGEIFGLGRPTANEIVGKLQMQKSDICQQFYEKRKSVDEICSFNDIDKLTTWAMILDGKDDLERLKKAGYI